MVNVLGLQAQASLQNRHILGERALNIPLSVYKPPSWIRKTLEAWGKCKRMKIKT